jgi:hypothetical protein
VRVERLRVESERRGEEREKKYLDGGRQTGRRVILKASESLL